MTMRHYEFLLPYWHNDPHQTSYSEERSSWWEIALDIAGGVTSLPGVDGSWRDPAVNGRTYNETMAPYRVLCSSVAKDYLVAEALRLFPDQISIFVADLGSAEIIYRKETKE